jgi:hypothetical protein
MTVAIFIQGRRKRGARCTIMAMGSARKLVGGAVGLVAGAARHALWYLRYQAEGVTRDDEPAPERKQK